MSLDQADARANETIETRSAGLRALCWFWAIVLLSLAGGAAALQVLGPPVDQHPTPAASPHVEGHPATAPAATAKTAQSGGDDGHPEGHPRDATAPVAQPAMADTTISRHAPGAPIAAPDPDLLATSTQYPDARAPRIAADGRMAMQVYAGGFDITDSRPRVALILAGIGQQDANSDDASRLLPAGITFAVSPYANNPARLLDGIRARGHEYLLSLPMEPQGYPVNDAGLQALLTGASPAQNQQRLEWALTRIAGYAGVTNALDGLRGERFSALTPQMNPVLESLAHRGLFYVDAVPAASRSIAFEAGATRSRTIDLVIDEPAVRVEIEQKLQRLEQIARDRGSAIGLAGRPHPVTIDRIAAWTNGLAAHGIALAPVSVLVMQPPPAAPGPLAVDTSLLSGRPTR